MIDPPVNTRLQIIDEYAKEVDKVLSVNPYVKSRLLFVSSQDRTYDQARLISWKKRPSCSVIADDIQKKLQDKPGLNARVYCPSSSPVGVSYDYPFAISLRTSGSYASLRQAAPRVMSFIRSQPAVNSANMNWDVPALSKEYEVTIKRDVAAALSVNVEKIATMIDMIMGTRKVGTFERESRMYPIRLTTDESNRRTPEDLKGLLIKTHKNNKEEMIPLAQLVEVTAKNLNSVINRYDGMRSVRIYADFKGRQGSKQFYNYVKPRILSMLPPGFRLEPIGELKRFIEEEYTVMLIFLLAILFIFLIMAAQFESFRDPFIIMLSVPLALFGGIFALWLAPGGSINIYSQIGFITLIGLITKHGILIVDFANQKQRQGLNPQDALITACQLRLRPILMTTFAMVLGALPLLIGRGPGFEARRQVGLVIVGGMSIGTLFTLYLIPVVYSFLGRKIFHREKP
jgi:multidrug efflux pump